MKGHNSTSYPLSVLEVSGIDKILLGVLIEQLAGGKGGDISSSIFKSIFKETSQLLLSLSG